jgi:hypothetical protein
MGLLPVIIAFATLSVGCLLCVVYKIGRHDDMTKAFLGLVTVVYAFIWGWQNARHIRVGRVGLADVMTVWSWCAGTALVFWMIMGDKT